MGENYEQELEDHAGAEVIELGRPLPDPESVLGPTCDLTTGCITCGDVALPLTVRRLDEARGLALCTDDGGNSETVEIELVGPVALGDRLLVHAGTAIAKLNEEDTG